MKRRFLVPEIVQSSQMDCGPAALSAVLNGFGLDVGFGRMREACQTSVDGTSIDTLEEVAVALGLPAEQMMLPDDHLLLPDTDLLPALAVVSLPGGGHHFIVIWRRHGRWFQIMDPAHGRKWVSARQLKRQLYQHRHALSHADWFAWARTSKHFVFPLIQRLTALGFSKDAAQVQVVETLQNEDYRPLATLDAATRCVRALKSGGAVRAKSAAKRLISRLYERDLAGDSLGTCIPEAYWSVNTAPQDTHLMMRGAVFISFQPGTLDEAENEPSETDTALRRAVGEKEPAVAGLLWQTIRADGWWAPLTILFLALLQAGGVLFETLLWRGLMEIGNGLPLPEQRLAGGMVLWLFAVTLLLLQIPQKVAQLRMGRNLETRLRAAFLAKIPRLGERYFHGRLTGDMAERNHMLHHIRGLPLMVTRLISAVCALVFTCGGAIWLAPHLAGPILLAGITAALLPLGIYPLLAERDMRVRAHEGALSRFYLDALKGAAPIRAHAAQGAVTREHERRLTAWVQAAYQLLTASTLTRLQSLVGVALTFWIVSRQVQIQQDGTLLLLIYWLLQIPDLGQQIAAAVSALPAYRSTTLRFMEPLAAPDEHHQPTATEPHQPTDTRGPALRFEAVAVTLGRQAVLSGVNLDIQPGEHLALVGPSGAGKSSLLGLLLGRYPVSEGAVWVDGTRLDNEGLPGLRRETAWIDPAVTLWNDTLLNNLTYGNEPEPVPLEPVLEAAELMPILDKRNQGLQTQIGEAGTRLSGGEGQRVRLGRGLLRRNARLILLDEAFRGLDRATRAAKLRMVRAWWPQATLIYVSHDLDSTLSFDRVCVIEGGRLVQDGSPEQLRNQPGPYQRLLRAEQELMDSLWADPDQRRLRLVNGKLEAQP
ncbi:ATP-binding cassette domain-containing protein [Acanthopleuribacter pedis]|uniref:ATP-binding cassette domain-containing protein n=1 Tax=Acanthopleuribacter pedis TaxID=442870 RepID=A0A8J7QAS3_9BACT|nr:ATP-binding cassette domain-containing protein [Acanthopleuribacter pedis]MBO1317366.1 ATP-binding cassette domain-containing protein [Acanthopleuribacter pedis]MBO1318673.1 ATP-binding cassette domain-containing protein [Acanthopleuribacter pedis]